MDPGRTLASPDKGVEDRDYGSEEAYDGDHPPREMGFEVGHLSGELLLQDADALINLLFEYEKIALRRHLREDAGKGLGLRLVHRRAV